MAKGDEKLDFPIGVPVETNAGEAASSVEALREQILGGTEAIRAMAGTLRQLRGSTDEVKAAKAALKTRIDAAKDSISSASLALVRQGTTYDAVAQKAKKMRLEELDRAKARAAAFSSAVSKAGGPVAALRDRLESLKSVLGSAGGGTALLTLGIAGLAAAAVAITMKVASLVGDLGKFILTSANAARSANLMREAWSGTAQNASNLGTQIDALADKVPTSKAALNELAISLMKSKIGGQATVDAFNAIGQASAALGDEAGGKLKAFIERGRAVGRLQINPAEMLEGFGNLQFEDIAQALSKSTKKGIKEAREALAMGRVKLADGAKAVRDAVESRFGDLNLRKMMDLNVLSEKLHEKWEALTSGVSLEPILKPAREFLKLFDSSTVTGETMKKIVTAVGTGLVGAMKTAIPVAKSFFQGMIIGGLRAYIVWLDLKNKFKETFGDKSLFEGIDLLNVGLKAGMVAAGALAVSLGLVAGSVAVIAIEVDKAVKALDFLFASSAENETTMKKRGWSWGTAITDGFVGSLVPGGANTVVAVKKLASSIKGAFTGALDIHSPSKVFEKYGKALPQGVTRGVESEAPRAAAAAGGMVPAPSGGGGGGARAAAPIHIEVHIHAGDGGSKELSSPSFLAQLTKSIEDALVGAGIPVAG